ncbi:hypothetical protein ADK75_13030 [Streptomyces virginiae]|uniref:Uncharacterized protein n=1 Tax=Streptomyces virginiae TaxID=1961 RepID=A0A0L8MWX3_STRVG|nr:hypothetical protein ADK75_13030 [Streptomyces virginiae]
MQVLFFPESDEVDVSGDATELAGLALVLLTGQGASETTTSTEAGFGGTALASIEVVGTDGPGVRIAVDPARGALVIEGDRAGLAALADDLRGVAEMDDGGQRHIEYYPDHHYLAADSQPIVVNSPHGGMPLRSAD